MASRARRLTSATSRWRSAGRAGTRCTRRRASRGRRRAQRVRRRGAPARARRGRSPLPSAADRASARPPERRARQARGASPGSSVRHVVPVDAAADPRGRDDEHRVEEERETDGRDRVEPSRREVLAHEHGGEEEERRHGRPRGGVVQAVVRRPHDEDADAAQQLAGDSERKQDVYSQRPGTRAKIRPLVHDATAATTARPYSNDRWNPSAKHSRTSVARTPAASRATSPSIGRLRTATIPSGTKPNRRAAAEISNAFTGAPRTSGAGRGRGGAPSAAHGRS